MYFRNRPGNGIKYKTLVFHFLCLSTLKYLEFRIRQRSLILTFISNFLCFPIDSDFVPYENLMFTSNEV